MQELNAMPEIELLRLHGAVIDELLRRGVVKSRNNPIGDFVEWLVCNRLGLRMQSNSQSAYDAIDDRGTRYQIKSRAEDRNRVQFSAIRNLDLGGFDHVIAVAFRTDYTMRFAVMIPHGIVKTLVRFQEHVNAHILTVSDDITRQPGVTNIAGLLNAPEGGGGH